MPFSKIEYLEWARLKPAVKYNLSGSSVGVRDAADIGLDWSGLSINGPNNYGYKPLLEAIAGRGGVSPANVATAGGTSMANFLVCATLIGPGDDVIVEKPCYGPLLDVPRALGARVRRLERRFRDGFQFDFDELKRMATRRTRLIILTDLHNPSGAKIPGETLERLAGLAESLRTHVLIDEVYLDFVPHKALPSCTALSPRLVSTGSLTKVYGLDGLRCGWVLGSEELIQRIWRVRDFCDANGAFPAEQIATRIFPKLPELRARAWSMVEANLPMVRKFVEGNPELSWAPPAAGVVSFPRHRDRKRLQTALKSLPELYDTLVVPGTFFESPAHFRIGCGVAQATLKTGLRNLQRALSYAGDSC